MSVVPNQSFASPGQSLFYTVNTPLPQGPAGPAGPAGASGAAGATGPTGPAGGGGTSGYFARTILEGNDIYGGEYSGVMLNPFTKQVTNGVTWSFPNFSCPVGTYRFRISGQVYASTAGLQYQLFIAPTTVEGMAKLLLTTTTITNTNGTPFSCETLVDNTVGTLFLGQLLSGFSYVTVTIKNLMISIEKV